MLIIVCIIGLCIGSFIHVVICRFNSNLTTLEYVKSFCFKRSHCPACFNKLSFYELIPIISWIILHKKCRHCLNTITLQYILFEIIISLYITFMFYFFNFTLWSFILILIALISIIIAVIDFKYYLIPNLFSYLLFMIGIFIALSNIGFNTIFDAIISATVAYILLMLPAKCFYFYKKIEGLGRGDIKLIVALATFIPFNQIPHLIIIASLFGIIHFIIIYIKRKKCYYTKIIPFAPHLLLSANIILLINTQYKLVT